jgi:hypothetical protein
VSLGFIVAAMVVAVLASIVKLKLDGASVRDTLTGSADPHAAADDGGSPDARA